MFASRRALCSASARAIGCSASVCEQVIVIEDRGVPEMVNEIASAQAILDAQLVINFRDTLIQLLRDVAREYDLAGSPHGGYELQYVYRRRVKPAYRNLVVWKACCLISSVAVPGLQRILEKDRVRPVEETGKVAIALSDGGRKNRNIVRPVPNPRPLPARKRTFYYARRSPAKRPARCRRPRIDCASESRVPSRSFWR